MPELRANGTNPLSNPPLEILVEIFTQCVHLQKGPISSKNGPLLFLRVCRRWREVAFSTPSLWQDIRMGRTFKGNPIPVLDLFFDKSGDLPLTITLPSHNPRLVALNEVVVNRVLDNFYRISALKGYVSRLFPYYVFKRLSALGASRRIYAPLMKRIDVAGSDAPPEISHKQWTEYLLHCIVAPNLEQLHLNTSRTILSMLSFTPDSLKILSGLNITEVAQVSDMSFLCQTSSLTTLEFSINDPREELPLRLPSSPVYFQKLKELRLAIIGTRFMGILRFVNFPCLERLSLNVKMGVSFSQALELLTKGQTLPIRYLCLSHSSDNFDPASALSCFLKFKEVEEVTFHAFPLLQETMLQSMLDKEGDKEENDFELFPQLSSIIIQNMMFTTGCRLVAEILRSRSTLNGGKLTYTKFLNCKFPLNDEQALRALYPETNGRLRIDVVQDEFPYSNPNPNRGLISI